MKSIAETYLDDSKEEYLESCREDLEICEKQLISLEQQKEFLLGKIDNLEKDFKERYEHEDRNVDTCEYVIWALCHVYDDFLDFFERRISPVKEEIALTKKEIERLI